MPGQPIKRSIFLKNPKEVETNNLWKLLETVYGLCDVPRAWYLNVEKVLEEAGAKKTKFNDAIFHWHNNDKLKAFLFVILMISFGAAL